jgi:hypothetical protein
MESLLLACLLSANVVALDNDYVLVTRCRAVRVRSTIPDSRIT